MFTMEDMHVFEAYLNNLLLCTMAHEFGVDVKKALSGIKVSLSPDYGSYMNTNALEIFHHLSIATFENVTYFEVDDNSDEKRFWFKKATGNELISTVESTHMFLIEEQTLTIDEHFTAGDHHEYGAEIYPVEKGIVIVMNEDYGDCDWSDVYKKLIGIQMENKNKVIKESNSHEMAV